MMGPCEARPPSLWPSSCSCWPSLPQAQGTAPATPLTLLSREGRRPVPTIVLSGQELVALDDVAALFQVAVREDTLAGGLTITYRGRTIVMSSEQPMASVSGRVVALPSPAVRSGNRWFVPLDFLPRALGPIYGSRIDLRRPSRLLVVGDLRVPRVTARVDIPGPPTRATIEIAPAAPVVATTEPGRVVLRIDADALDLTLPAGGGGLIDAIRAGDQPSTVAVLLNERSGPARTVSADANGNTRVTIEVPGIAPPSDTTAAPPAAAPPAPGIAAPPPVFSTSRAAVQTIVIDPGHGGDDVGVRGARGAQEKTVTLEVARRLRTLVEMRLGIRVVLTRDEDRTITLDERAAIANNSKADLFLSLHLNAAPVAAVAGAEVFYLRLDREGEDARRAAESEEVPLPVLGGDDALDRRDPVGPGAGAPRRGVCRPGRDSRAESPGASHDEPAAAAGRPPSRADGREHAGCAHRDGLPQQRRPGASGAVRGVPVVGRAGALQRDRRFPRPTWKISARRETDERIFRSAPASSSSGCSRGA